ncbi:TIGR00730 family Rossman fold protein [Parendozoicomonas sp. Alg238-R29]|uniref:LOG family protein n=1 Tax=Parendozoicomonas sp. Alg238-R29 TaxID=2993446 RepID=UPI00248ED744|nr:TIGR00730 family Rossman fold protein [Parendozoicomonas sp. Alg238-R29]
MQSVCVFCGARPGNDPDILNSTLQLADTLVAHNKALVYGGSSTGLMGTLADRVLEGGGKVIGIIPNTIVDMEIAHMSLTEQHIVADMASRKNKMMDIADACIALPGGFGTLDELFEALTNAQLRLHSKPVGILNVNGYYDSLINFLDHACSIGLLAPQNRQLLHIGNTPEELLNSLGEQRFRPA